jgi:triphosphatase
MLKHSKASEPSVFTPVVSVGAKRANAHPVQVKEEESLRQSPVETRAEGAIERTVLETELKLDVSAEHLDILKNHPLFRNLRSSGKHELVSIYLDTTGRTFGRQGLSLRLRRKGKQLFRTIKGTYRGILERTEWETPFNCDGGNQPGSVDAFFKRLEDRRLPTVLKPIFKTRIEREIYQLGGIEVCLDKGEIIAGPRSAPVAEIELELKSGDRASYLPLQDRFRRLFRRKFP